MAFWEELGLGFHCHFFTLPVSLSNSSFTSKYIQLEVILRVKEEGRGVILLKPFGFHFTEGVQKYI